MLVTFQQRHKGSDGVRNVCLRFNMGEISLRKEANARRFCVICIARPAFRNALLFYIFFYNAPELRLVVVL